jgi:hypothetical protein
MLIFNRLNKQADYNLSKIKLLRLSKSAANVTKIMGFFLNTKNKNNDYYKNLSVSFYIEYFFTKRINSFSLYISKCSI